MRTRPAFVGVRAPGWRAAQGTAGTDPACGAALLGALRVCLRASSNVFLTAFPRAPKMRVLLERMSATA
eukprot:CAMPEP_0177442848 /NCGR_PEP_ID=MMETSP0369-20130122/5159_1 /TAXON_ID=447022 ORGANISM="Scrippsiella hangoei-like, Strain SHHI-4" /NCGR_SAMPLE_ID=MMETSP0369 /ASSEMBLY_ACC=CAM_ASM_000364 /LENGTH=68 /DNA_ID=CAMNT_0018914813 /DNA_START=20 /DNA_END=226 /DNA_ORIENTATION=+